MREIMILRLLELIGLAAFKAIYDDLNEYEDVPGESAYYVAAQRFLSVLDIAANDLGFSSAEKLVEAYQEGAIVD